ncbi:MAG: ATP-binding protein [Prevotella sp.]|nr:ATP-binding protein [Prevotella sp.]
MEKIKRLAYGISDFRQVMREGLYYVDKTTFLPIMEETDHFLFLIRPRRFGKSVFLSMLRCYYDVNERETFGKTFQGLWIADHPTPEMGKFQVLHLDFSRIGGSLDTLEEDFGDYCSLMLDDFADRYAPFYGPDYASTIRTYKSFRTKFSYIDNQAKRKGYPLYLIIDEYDNFTNTVLNEKGEAVYHALTHASGFYRDVFKLFKGMFARILMMGVSPVTMDDLTSGYNIASNISMRPEFNLMLGFSEDDVRQMIRYYQGLGMIKYEEEELIEEMKPWYDNYCFAEESVDTDPKMFNCDMVLYYLNRVMQTGKSPREMIDPNTRTDYTKMKKLIQLDKLDGNRLGLIHEIAENGYTYGELAESFPAEELTKPQMFVSLLFYYGMLTIGGMFGAKVKLIIPNNNVRRQYYGYLKEEYQKIAYVDTTALSNAYDQAAINGDWQAMLATIADIYRKTTSVRQLIEGERNLQGFMNAYLTLCPYYLTAPEVELSHGFCDFFLMPDMRHYPMIRHSYILELKYLKTEATETEAQAQWLQAEEQIRQYAQSERVKYLAGDTQLHLLIMQIQGYETIRMDEV